MRTLALMRGNVGGTIPGKFGFPFPYMVALDERLVGDTVDFFQTAEWPESGNCSDGLFGSVVVEDSLASWNPALSHFPSTSSGA
jgi:hypothetical protein